MEFDIRLATSADVPAIAAIHAASWQTTYRGLLPDDFLATITPASREPMWRHILSRSNHPGAVWVAIHDGIVTGFCSAGPSRPADEPSSTLDLYAIYVQPGYERRGIGRALIRQVHQFAAEQGYDRLTLLVLRGNANARAFYEADGWMTDDVPIVAEVWGQPVTEVQYVKNLSPDP